MTALAVWLSIQFAFLFSFWVFYPALVFLVVMFALVAHDGPWYSFSISIVVFVLVLQAFGGAHIFQFIVAHPVLMLGMGVAYFGIGLLYTRYCELPLFCRRVVDEYNQQKQMFIGNWRPATISDPHTTNAVDAWTNECSCRFPQFQNGEFSINYYKGKILAWMAYWPWYATWRLVHDLLRELWEAIYRQFQEMFQRVANRCFAGILKDLKRPDDESSN